MPRVVSLSPSITDTLVSLGADDEVVGVSVYCRPYAPPHAEVVGDYVSVRLERLRELSPDLVFTSGAAQARLAERLRSLGYRVVHLEIPSSLYGVADMAWRVGVEVGRLIEAADLAARLAESFNRLRGATPPTRILYVIDLGEPVSPGALSYAGHALLHLGLRNVYEAVKTAWVKPSTVDVKRYAPELVVYEARVEEPSLEQARRALSRWRLFDEKNLERVRIAAVPRDTLAHYGPRLAENLQKLAEVLGAARKRVKL